jgi:F-type H+-transporting ATPase subunit delta
MSELVVAERYAKALFELGLESGQLAMLTDQLRSVAHTYAESPELRAVLHDPRIGEDRIVSLIDVLAQRLALSAVAKNSLLVLVRRRRIRALPDIVSRLASLTDERTGVLRAIVTSANALAEAQTQQLTLELERLTGKRIVLERRTDPSLLGGLVARIGDHVVDASLRGRFDDIERRLSESPN